MREHDLFERWMTLWASGLQQVWRTYTGAQDAIYRQGRALVGLTPAEEVHREGRVRLLHYAPLTTRTHPVPLLCIPSMINHYYVMDLTPERSLVRYLLSQGIDVYMLDWGVATDVDRFRSLDEYIAGVLHRAVDHVRHTSGQNAISLLGYCMGGMMAAIYAVLHPHRVANLISLAGPINYHDDGIYSVWTRPEWFDVDLMVDSVGNIPPELLNITFKMVRPTDELIRALDYWERRHDEQYMRRYTAMQLWTNDPTPFPGEAFRKYIKDCYQRNLLIQGQFTVNGQAIDLSRITAPTLTIAAREDHIAPWESVAVLDEIVSGPDHELIVLESGHIGMVVGSSAHRDLWPR